MHTLHSGIISSRGPVWNINPYSLGFIHIQWGTTWLWQCQLIDPKRYGSCCTVLNNTKTKMGRKPCAYLFQCTISVGMLDLLYKMIALIGRKRFKASTLHLWYKAGDVLGMLQSMWLYNLRCVHVHWPLLTTKKMTLNNTTCCVVPEILWWAFYRMTVHISLAICAFIGWKTWNSEPRIPYPTVIISVMYILTR